MLVPLFDAGVDAGGVDLELGPGIPRRMADVDSSLERREVTSDLGHHEVTGDRPDHRVVRVELPRPRRRHPGSLVWSVTIRSFRFRAAAAPSTGRCFGAGRPPTLATLA